MPAQARFQREGDDNVDQSELAFCFARFSFSFGALCPNAKSDIVINRARYMFFSMDGLRIENCRDVQLLCFSSGVKSTGMLLIAKEGNT